MKKTLKSELLALVALLSVAACDSDDDDENWINFDPATPGASNSGK